MNLETASVAEWLGCAQIPVELTTRQIVEKVKTEAFRRWPSSQLGCSLARRWPGHDPRPDVDANYEIIEVFVWKTIVDDVKEPEREVAHADLPRGVRVNRKIGDPWYEVLAHVLVSGHR